VPKLRPDSQVFGKISKTFLLGFWFSKSFGEAFDFSKSSGTLFPFQNEKLAPNCPS
jgi:hypothetical protein